MCYSANFSLAGTELKSAKLKSGTTITQISHSIIGQKGGQRMVWGNSDQYRRGEAMVRSSKMKGKEQPQHAHEGDRRPN